MRKLSLQSALSYGSVHKCTKILKLHPYRVHVMHKLKEPGMEKRLQYCILPIKYRYMHAWLRAVDISNTQYNIVFLFSDFNVIYFLTIRTGVTNGFCDSSITLYIL
jgi:predicted metal-binding transcription factor (methanogenesis marker protein 9)